MRLVAVVLWVWKAAVAFRVGLGPERLCKGGSGMEVEVLVVEAVREALARSDSSSWQAISKYSRLMRIWTIWPRYCEDSFETRLSQTLVVRRSSRESRSL